MFNSIPSLYELGNGFSDSYNNILQDVLLNSSPTSTDSPRSMAEAKAMAASNSHKEAERRRRKRINDHIATLKSILPNSIKTDKASLLGEAVRRVRELKKTASQLSSATTDVDIDSNDNTNLFKPIIMFPTETDELKLEVLDDSGLIKATMCCEDRPEMILDLIQALKSAKAKVVKAEMSTIGGRTKNVLWVQVVSSSTDHHVVVGSESDVSLGTLRRALKNVMDKSTLLAGSDQGLPGHKRPRYYHF